MDKNLKTRKISHRINILMEKKGISMAALAERTGLSELFLKRVRDDGILPSLGPLLKIARALGVRLGTFLDDQITSDPVIVRHSDRKEELSMLRDKEQPLAARFYSLGRGKSDRHMEPFFIELLPESSKDRRLSSHEGEEFIVVIDGEVSIVFGQETYLLQPGDSIYFNSVVPHHVGSSTEKTATIYAVIYLPE